MAITRLTIDGYGQVELNQVAFRRDGRIEAQCKLFAGTEEAPGDFYKEYCENGMLLAVDNIRRIVKKPVAGEAYPIALVYSAEVPYDERHQGLKDFALSKDGYLPRLGYLSAQDKYTTNCLAYDTDEFADDAAFIEAVKEATKAESTAPLFGTECELGVTLVTATVPETNKVKMIAAKATTMPDGQFAIKFHTV